MSSYSISRAKSSLTVSRAHDIERSQTVPTLSRVSSTPCLDLLHVTDPLRSSALYRYRRDRSSFDDYWYDRMYYYPSVFWPDYRFFARRQLVTDPYYDPLSTGYPSFWYRYKWYVDWLNPDYWRRYRDPNYDRPLWNNWQPWRYDRINTKRAIRMFREGLIDFDTLDKHWIEPTALDRRGKDWSDIYLPAGRYGARRYFYSFQV